MEASYGWGRLGAVVTARAAAAGTLLLAALPAWVGAQSVVADTSFLSPSAAIVAARKAQKDFESLRRRHLPFDGRWSSGTCDARFRRMCWRYHELVTWTPRPDAPAVGTARDSLLAELARAAEGAPGDPWILGQRVRYLLEADRPGEALSLARGCGRSPSWWCAALEGLVLHVAGLYPESERAFDRSLAGMDPDQAASWTDVSALLDGAAKDLLSRAAERSSAERNALVRTMWTLADPLYLVPGNDRLTAHLARRTLEHILADAATPYDMPWGDDMSEFLVRYGWDQGWERVASLPGAQGIEKTVGFEDPDMRTFIPSGALLSAVGGSDGKAPAPEGWVAGLSPASRSGYAPAYAPVLLPMTSRLLLFTRGTHTLVAATFDLPADTTLRTRKGYRTAPTPPPALRGLPIQAGLVLAAVDSDALNAMRSSGAARGAVGVDVPAGDYVASAEVLDVGAGRAGRFRTLLRVPVVAPDAPVLSSLLLVHGDSLPGSTAEAVRRLRIDDAVEVGRPLVVGWEVWGLGWKPEMLRYRLSLRPEQGGVSGRLRTLIGGAPGQTVLEWQEPGPDQPGAAFRSRRMDLPQLDPGTYTLRLELSLEGRGTLVSEQRVVVVRP